MHVKGQSWLEMGKERGRTGGQRQTGTAKARAGSGKLAAGSKRRQPAHRSPL